MSQLSERLAFDARSLEELVESEHRHRKLVESLPDAIVVHTEGRIVFANPFALRLHKASNADQLLGREIRDFIAPQCLPEITQGIQQCYDTGATSSLVELVLIACDGSSVDVEAVAIPISWNGSPAIEVVLRDVTERKRAEKAAVLWQNRLELAQKGGLLIGLWDWDLGRNTVEWSDESYQQFGFDRETFSGGVDEALARVHPDDRERITEVIARVLKGEAKEYAAQYRLVHPNGAVRWIDAHGVRIGNGSEHMIGVGIDITDLKHTEQCLKMQAEQLRALSSRVQTAREEERKQVARDLHDQIGQILTVVKMDVDWVCKRIPEEQPDLRTRLESTFELLRDGTQTVRKICTELRPGVLDDLGLAAAIEWQAKDFAARTNITCEVSTPSDDVDLDPDHATAIFRIFQEALTNIARHAEATTVRASVAHRGGRLLLVVQDNGKGISETDSAAAKGSLGLLGMKERAQACGGQLQIWAEPESETTVAVDIPIKKSEKQDDHYVDFVG